MADVKLEEGGNINSLEDRLWAVANAVSLEEHAYSSYLRTNDNKYLTLMEEYRTARKKLMLDILGPDVQNSKAELWCMFKHSAAAAMRAYESGNRYVATNSDYANSMFELSRLFIHSMLVITELAEKGTAQIDFPKETLVENTKTGNDVNGQEFENKTSKQEDKKDSKWYKSEALIKALRCCFE